MNIFPRGLATFVGLYRSTRVDLFRLLGGRLLNLNGGRPIGLCHIHRDCPKVAVGVARSNRYAGLFTRRDWDHPAVDQYRHAKRCVGISGIDLFHFLFGFFLTRRSRTDSKKNKFTLNVIADDRVIEEKDRGAGEPLQFYTGSERLLCEVVSLSVEKNKVPAI